MGRRSGSLPAVLCLLGLLGVWPAWGETWYVSNRLGMRIDTIPRYRADEFAYVLSETTRDTVTVSTLYHRGETASTPSEPGATPLVGPPLGADEITRWERETLDGGGVVETVYERGVLDRVSLLRPDGRVTSETIYVEGVPTETIEYGYVSGYLRSLVSRRAEGGEPLWEVRYDLTPDGRLRASRRTGSEPETAAFGMTGGRLQEEYLTTPGHLLVLRYDTQGRRVVWEVYGEDTLLRAKYDAFDPDTGTLASSRDLSGDTERTEHSYDAEGRVVAEVSYRNEVEVSVTRHTYDADGRLRSTERRSDAGIESWSFRYDEAGELEVEEYRDRGTLRLRIVHSGPDERYEEIVQSARSSLRVYYVEDRRVREDFVRDGKVVSRRALEGG